MSIENTSVSTNRRATDLDFSQWQVGPNGRFRPATQTIPHLEPGVYKPMRDDMGLYLQLQNVLSDNIVQLPETANVRVLNGMKKFWDSKEKYEKFGFIYKRGILLWGPPGSGKTVTINLLMKELIGLRGIVLLCSDPEIMEEALMKIRIMEMNRPLIVVMEDIDEMIERHQEHSILSMLDGENQIANVVYLATTNYPERLGARIVNRPSRFDERIFVGMPSVVARRHYLKFAASELTDEMLDQWVKDTDQFSVAHLRELVAASYCLDQDYKTVLNRLKSMTEKPKFVDGYRRGKTGFGANNDDEEDGTESSVSESARSQRFHLAMEEQNIHDPLNKI